MNDKIQYIYSNRLNLGTLEQMKMYFGVLLLMTLLCLIIFLRKIQYQLHQGNRYFQKKIHDSSITSFKYNNNKMGHIFVSWLHPFKEHRFVIIGSNGMLHFEDSNDTKPLLFL